MDAMVPAQTATISQPRRRHSSCVEEHKDASSNTQRSTSTAAVRFACPFFKADPCKIEPNSICARNTWPSIARVKEHLYRRHAPRKVSCPRCAAPFDREKELADHIRAKKPCEISDPRDRSSQTISPAQMYLLRRRNTQSRDNEEQKWFKIFSILFPEKQKPASPYSECRDGLWGCDHTMEHLQKSVPQLVAAAATRDLREKCLLQDDEEVEQLVKTIIADHISAAFHQHINHGSYRHSTDNSEEKPRKTLAEYPTLSEWSQESTAWNSFQGNIPGTPTLVSPCTTVHSESTDHGADFEIILQDPDPTNMLPPMYMEFGPPSDTSELTASQGKPGGFSPRLKPYHDESFQSLLPWEISIEQYSSDAFPTPPLDRECYPAVDLERVTTHNGPHTWSL